MDSILLRVLWNNLISIATEQARALQRNAFSPIVRDAGDLAVAILDQDGRLVANAVTGAPGHINTMMSAGRYCLETFPKETLSPGDQLITNDPWLAAGHLFDITIFTPIFRRDRLIGFMGSCIHHGDVGGYGIGAGARDIHEEGLWLPFVKLHDAVTPNAALLSVIRRNVRYPDQLMGDLAAQISCGLLGGERLNALCDRYGLDDIVELSQIIIDRSEISTREAVRRLKSGVYHGATTFDLPGIDEITIKTAITIDAEKGEMRTDFTGSSPASPFGINVCLNYAAAYNSYTIRCCLNPEVPNNYGSMLPFSVSAPEGCIVNAAYPSPVAARHVVGQYVPMPIMKALYAVLPDRVLAECAGGLWTSQVIGESLDAKPFASALFASSGGMGARAGKPGLSATSYPSGTSAVPVEVLEAEMPIVFDRKEILRGTGGRGKFPGGDGQIVQFHLRTRRPWTLNHIVSRIKTASEGVAGGEPGQPGKFTVNGEPVTQAAKLLMKPDDIVIYETPGGGGFGAATLS
jgi:N-methylhydantoinase B